MPRRRLGARKASLIYLGASFRTVRQTNKFTPASGGSWPVTERFIDGGADRLQRCPDVIVRRR